MIILKRPIVTEKTAKEYEEENKVTFEVTLDANKIKAKNMLEEVYEVEVEKVWVINRLGKMGLSRTTRQPQRKSRDMKLMKFKLKKGSSIDIFKT